VRGGIGSVNAVGPTPRVSRPLVSARCRMTNFLALACPAAAWPLFASSADEPSMFLQDVPDCCLRRAWSRTRIPGLSIETSSRTTQSLKIDTGLYLDVNPADEERLVPGPAGGVADEQPFQRPAPE